MKWKRTGSLTVEAALVVSMAIVAAGILLSLSFFVYQRCWYTQAACEAALTGSFRGVLEGEDPLHYGKEKWKTREQDFYLRPAEMVSRVSGGSDRVQIEVEGKTNVWGRAGFTFRTEISRKVIRPTVFIRKTEAFVGTGA